MRNKLIDWLNRYLEDHDISMRELSRRAGYSSALVSEVINANLEPSADFCIKTAKATGAPAVDLLRMAGILPPSIEDMRSENPTLDELCTIAATLPAWALHAARAMVRGLAEAPYPGEVNPRPPDYTLASLPTTDSDEDEIAQIDALLDMDTNALLGGLLREANADEFAYIALVLSRIKEKEKREARERGRKHEAMEPT